jgi:hypothetical protein
MKDDESKIRTLISELLLEFAYELFDEKTLLDIKNAVDKIITPDEATVKLSEDGVLIITIIDEKGPKYRLEARMRQ